MTKEENNLLVDFWDNYIDECNDYSDRGLTFPYSFIEYAIEKFLEISNSAPSKQEIAKWMAK